MDDFLFARMADFSERLAIAEAARSCDYHSLLGQTQFWRQRLARQGIAPGQVVSLEGEYGVLSVSVLLALLQNGNILVPLSRDSRQRHQRFLEIAQVEQRIELNTDPVRLTVTGHTADHHHYQTLRQRQHPGLVLFTSGSTGDAKAVVHDLAMLLEKFRPQRQCLRTLVFLQLDHIGGINTLLYTLSNGGAVIVPANRSPVSVCQAIASHRVELLPTSPTFLNLLLLSEQVARHDLSSLKLITYGTEPMPQSTLTRVAKLFPGLLLQQTYGMTELGILRSKSRDSQSLWVKIGGEGFDIKIRDGRLWVRAQSAMLGYLNAPSPFDSEGYFDTGDQVEVDGEWVHILGRKSETINVGGNKVFPAEVESVLLEMEGVADAAVHGEPHPIMGQIVTARIQLHQSEMESDLKIRVRRFCGERLPAFAVPMRVVPTLEPLHSERFKRMRQPVVAAASHQHAT